MLLAIQFQFFLVSDCIIKCIELWQMLIDWILIVVQSQIAMILWSKPLDYMILLPAGLGKLWSKS